MAENAKKEKQKMSLASQIFIALAIAIVVGLLMQKHADFAVTYIKPFGTIFLNLIKFIVGPIVLFSIMAGVVSMKDIKKVGAIGGTTILYYLCTTAFATAIGLALANIFKGTFPVLSVSDLTYEAQEGTSFMDTIVNIFPSNFLAPLYESTMLQVIVMALILGFAIILIGEKGYPAVKGIEVINDVCMKAMEMILKLSPIGVFCLLCPVIAENGAMIIGSLAKVLSVSFSKTCCPRSCLPSQVLHLSELSRSTWNAARTWVHPRKWLPSSFRSARQSTWTEQPSIRVSARSLLLPVTGSI